MKDIFPITNGNKADNEIEKKERINSFREKLNKKESERRKTLTDEEISALEEEEEEEEEAFTLDYLKELINAGMTEAAFEYLEEGVIAGFDFVDGFDDIDVFKAIKAQISYSQENEVEYMDEDEDVYDFMYRFFGGATMVHLEAWDIDIEFSKAFRRYIERQIMEDKKEIRKEKINQAKLDEKKRILSNLSHHIKNMIGTIIDPLENMKSSNELQPVAIENAIRGANLVRSLVNAMNQSLKGSIQDFQYDIKEADYNNSTSLYQMFIDSLKYSISSMFDGKYFEKFMRNYFPTKSIFLNAKNKWNEISQSSDLQAIVLFMDTFMLQTEFNFEQSKDFVIGNYKGSSLKLLILIQEMIFNAVKYSSFVPQQERFLKIVFNYDADHVSFIVSNKYQPQNKVKSSGLGHEIINNFSKLLETKPLTKEDDEIFSVEVKFKNLWEV
ncbi:MAG: hypothetical protein P9L97_09410 [Candidatus Tenebribacter davisii]|nr:hypothetical protein [Candidatus Tenebribacter davisii]